MRRALFLFCLFFWIGFSCNNHDLEDIDKRLNHIPELTTQELSSKVDLLFVIDNSGSMCQEQANLAVNFKTMAQMLEDSDVDYHIAIVTTDYINNPDGFFSRQPVENILANYSKCAQSGADCSNDSQCNTHPDIEQICVNVGKDKDTNEDIMKCVTPPQTDDCPDIEYPGYLTKEKIAQFNTDHGLTLEKTFSCLSQVGTSGDGIEMGLATARKALELSKVTTLADNPNEGFLRDDASLALLFITDENDCSGEVAINTDCFEKYQDLNDVKEYVNFFKQKRDEKEIGDILIAGIIGEKPTAGTEKGAPPTPSCNSDNGIAFDGWRYREVMGEFDKNLEMSICEDDFRETMDVFTEEIKCLISSIKLDQPITDEKAVKVKKIFDDGRPDVELVKDVDFEIIKGTDNDEIKLANCLAPGQGERINIVYLSELEL